ncbi:hypothetical protein WICPIJ_001341 [Wickerhamomyces pijperi]|uniref:Bul1 N-terminal domain-containing protein n=1 Tax=Wickerhamomyces pijperi TaxID=599730 RepID=A0A9P8QBU7_WICPI|nr:hypothetical protein WICPIJ_001341 [Wickerhamomyces pijperi]
MAQDPPNPKVLSPKEQEFLEQQRQAKSSNPDAIDYTPAFRRESQRRQQLDEYFKLNNLEHFNKPVILNSELTEKLPPIALDDPVFQKNAYFDVLPSFEMYHSLQYHTPLDIVQDTAAPPPNYVPSITSVDSNDIIPTISNLSTVQTTDIPLDPTASSTSAFTTVPIGSDYFDKNIVDNYHRLAQSDIQGLNITVHVTKNVPGPHTNNENESILKEYTSGDIVHGYVVIDNQTGRDIPFQSFYVTLEGVAQVIDANTKTLVKQKFLTMVDLSATWCIYYISSSAVNQECVYGGTDKVDGCFFGLPDERILKAGVKYKKFFTFKFPYNALDDKCRHDQNLHLLLPPSFGFNKIYKKGKYAKIEIDPVLMYGYRSIPGGGGPVIVNDMAHNLISINYSINAFFVDDQAKNSRGNLTVVKHQEHFLRFVPFGFAESLFSSKNLLSHFKSIVEMNLRNCQNFLEGDVKPKTSITQNTYASATRLQDQGRSNSGPLRFPIRNGRSDPTEVTRHMAYQSKPSTSKFNIGKSSSKKPIHGLLTITSKVPKDGIPYIAPQIIQNANKKDNLNNKGMENITHLLDTLEINEKKIIDEITLDLMFETSFNGESGNLPELKSVEIELMAMNIFSRGEIPMKLSHDIFLDQDDNGDLLAGFKDQFKPYLTEYEQYERQFKQLDVPITSQFDKMIHRDLLAIQNMKYDVSTISNIFHTKTSFKNQASAKWVQISNTQHHQSITVHFDLRKEIVKETLVPTFQSCLITRAYFMNVILRFKDGVKSSIKIPVRVRKFDEFS